MAVSEVFLKKEIDIYLPFPYHLEMKFLAKYKNRAILATRQGYAPIDFSFDNFDWEQKKGKWIDFPNIDQELSEPPLFSSPKIICVGRNYRAHAEELGNVVPAEPLLFLKPSSSIIGPKNEIILPEMSAQVEHEVELVVVISKRGKNIAEAEVMDYVLGYTIGLDITARDLQKKDKTWFRGKGFDTFAPLGPWVIEKDQLDLANTPIRLYVNEQLRQDGNTSLMVFKVPELINYISKIVTLYPGDLIFTGTPAGVGKIEKGDVLKAEIPPIGQLEVNVADQ